MADGRIEIDSDGVRATMASVKGTYDTLKGNIDAMIARKSEISSFWQSEEATTFEEELTNVSKSFDNFYSKHDSILKIMGKMMSDVDATEASATAAFNDFAGGGSN